MNNNEFITTKGYLRFKEFCDACMEYKYIGICYGAPGVGKTKSAEQYSEKLLKDSIPKDQFGTLITNEAPKELDRCKTILYTPMPPFSPSQMNNQLYKEQITFNLIIKAANINRIKYEQPELSVKDIDSLEIASIRDNKDYFKLIIIDEAERLNVNALEILRALYDQLNVSFIFIGMPGLEKKLSRYPQLYSRIGFAHEYRTLSKDEMIFMLEHHWKKLNLTFKPEDFADHEAMTAIIRITNGNFRLVDRLFMQIDRILKLNDIKNITQEVVLAARECLLIGTA
ncbi:TPA: AAA family ATPase [Legionella pneumophila]|nr:AAA family ATPase [Legionella pneumophila]